MGLISRLYQDDLEDGGRKMHFCPILPTPSSLPIQKAWLLPHGEQKDRSALPGTVRERVGLELRGHILHFSGGDPCAQALCRRGVLSQNVRFWSSDGILSHHFSLQVRNVGFREGERLAQATQMVLRKACWKTFQVRRHSSQCSTSDTVSSWLSTRTYGPHSLTSSFIFWHNRKEKEGWRRGNKIYSKSAHFRSLLQRGWSRGAWAHDAINFRAQTRELVRL